MRVLRRQAATGKHVDGEEADRGDEPGSGLHVCRTTRLPEPEDPSRPLLRAVHRTGVIGDRPVTGHAIREIIRYYTREAGNRNLERLIGGVFPNVAMRIAEGTIDHLAIGPDEVTEILGGRRFESETAMRTSVPGVATGLAWTPVGGGVTRAASGARSTKRTRASVSSTVAASVARRRSGDNARRCWAVNRPPSRASRRRRSG